MVEPTGYWTPERRAQARLAARRAELIHDIQRNFVVLERDGTLTLRDVQAQVQAAGLPIHYDRMTDEDITAIRELLGL